MSEQYVIKLSGFPYFWGKFIKPWGFSFLIFLSTESSSLRVNGLSLMSNHLRIILVIGSCVTFGVFPSRFSKCSFHSFILSCWLVAFCLVLGSTLPSPHFVYRLPCYLIYPIFHWVSNIICIPSVLLSICLLIHFVPFLVSGHLCELSSSYCIWWQFSLLHVFL